MHIGALTLVDDLGMNLQLHVVRECSLSDDCADKVMIIDDHWFHPAIGAPLLKELVGSSFSNCSSICLGPDGNCWRHLGIPDT